MYRKLDDPNVSTGTRVVCKAKSNAVAYRVVTLGIMLPPVRVSTSRMNGIMDKTLWWDEKGVSQWTARLWTHTTRTGMLIGSTQSMRMRMECA